VAGQPDLAIKHLEASLRLDPRSPTLRPYYLTGIGIADFLKQQFEQAASFFRASLQQAPSFVMTYRYLASCYGHMGRLDDAREIVKRLEAITPVVAPSGPITRNPEIHALLLSGLRLAAGEAT
jgi:pentatricopeptide repeat protein